MSRKAKLNGARIAKYKRNLAKWVLNPTPAEVESAAKWYPETLLLCEDIAKVGNFTLKQTAAIFSALSPRVSYQQNIKMAYQFARNEKVDGMTQSVNIAKRCKVSGLSGLKGLKTSAFAANILGDTKRVTVDVWHCKASGLNRDTPNKTQYLEIQRATQLLAMDLGLEPSTLQALIWVRIRGKAD
jgi:hypothetical protein